MRRRLLRPIAALATFAAIGAITSCQAPRATGATEVEPQGAAAQAAIGDQEKVIALDEAQIARSGIVVRSLSQKTVPEAAVVWLEGKAWAYVEAAPHHFLRRELSPTGSAQPDAAFALKAEDRGKPVAVVGAQLLLSHEFRSQLEAGEDS